MYYDNIQVIKRNGTKENFEVKKVNTVTEWCTSEIKNVSQGELEAELSQFLHGLKEIKSTDLHELVIKSATKLITAKRPNYQYVAARAALFKLRKDVLGQFEPVHLSKIIIDNTQRHYYDPLISESYTAYDINNLNSYIKHERDFNFTFSGLQQVIDKYLVRNRITKTLYETPQYMYMLIAMALFKSEANSNKRLELIKKYYDSISTFKLNIPTPIMSGCRTSTRQYSSCVLIDMGDSLDSINASRTVLSKYISRKAGIGLNIRIRALGDSIRNGEIEHTGIIPYIQTNEKIVRETMQGARGGSATCFLPFWHLEINDYIVLKNNKGTEETRARKLDFCIKLSKIFYERYLGKQKITLFSPNEVPELVEAFGTPDFDKVYKEAEKRKGIRKVKIDAVSFFHDFIQERVATGRMYIMHVDHVNSHSSFIPTIHMSNLCVEITLLTKPIIDVYDDKGEIALCILSAINVGECETDEDLETVCELAVRGLDSVIDEQEYVCPSSEIPAKKRRPLGIGITNLAYYLAKRKLKYSDKESIRVVHELQEKVQFYLLKASCLLAKEKGPCEYFNETKYSQGLLPIDTYRRTVDDLCDNTLVKDWEWLRKEIGIYGLRNSTLSAQMPCESSSVASNSTNGHDPVRSLVVEKRSKMSSLTQLAPNFEKVGKYYELQFDMPSNKGYLSIIAVMQKFIDQSISTNTFYDYTRYPDEKIPMSLLVEDILFGYKHGIKTFYYNVTPDDRESVSCSGGGCSV